MEIKANKQEEALLQSFCDIALRADGIKNLQGVNLILGSINKEKPEKKPKK